MKKDSIGLRALCYQSFIASVFTYAPAYFFILEKHGISVMLFAVLCYDLKARMLVFRNFKFGTFSKIWLLASFFGGLIFAFLYFWHECQRSSLISECVGDVYGMMYAFILTALIGIGHATLSFFSSKGDQGSKGQTP